MLDLDLAETYPVAAPDITRHGQTGKMKPDPCVPYSLDTRRPILMSVCGIDQHKRGRAYGGCTLYMSMYK